jgi:hypothetical protein
MTIESIEQRLEKATEGPWGVEETHQAEWFGDWLEVTAGGDRVALIQTELAAPGESRWEDDELEESIANAELCAHAYEDLRILVEVAKAGEAVMTAVHDRANSEEYRAAFDALGLALLELGTME